MINDWVTTIIKIYADGRTHRPVIINHAQCLGAMCTAAVGAGAGPGHEAKSKCPLCRTSFSSADVVSGAELESAGASNIKTQEGENVKQEAVREPVEAEAGDVPPPKVAALLQR